MIVVKRILAPVDLGEPSAQVLEYAKELASRFDASLDVLHVVRNPFVAETLDMYIPVLPDLLDNLVKQATERLEQIFPLADRKSVNALCTVKVGDPRATIIEYAEAEHVDLIVMGTHGRSGVAHLILGSVAERVVRAVRCPVLTVR